MTNKSGAAATAPAVVNEITVDPSWSAQRINAAIATAKIIRFEAGEYQFDRGLTVTKGVTLKAVDPNNQPRIIVNNTSAFEVNAPESDVTIENMHFWHTGETLNNVISCDRFSLTGCKPVPADPARGRDHENFAINCGPSHVGRMELSGNKFAGQNNCLVVAGPDIGQIKLTNNEFIGGNHVIHIEPEKSGGPAHVELELQRNKVKGTVGVIIGSYQRVSMIENEITINGYTLDFIAVGGTVCTQTEGARAELVNNRIKFELPAPRECSWLPGVMQFAVGFNLGNPYYDLPAYNVTMNGLKVSCPFPLGKVLQTYRATNCRIQNMERAGVQLMTTPYDIIGEALLAANFGNNYLFEVGCTDAADYSFLRTNSLNLIDNATPTARIFEWQTAGSVTCEGKLKQVSRRDRTALTQQSLNAMVTSMSPRWKALLPRR